MSEAALDFVARYVLREANVHQQRSSFAAWQKMASMWRKQDCIFFVMFSIGITKGR